MVIEKILYMDSEPGAQANSGDTSKISVYHGIDGKRLGLSRELPVIASVYKDGVFLADIPVLGVKVK
jgi:hypothetical protein